MIEAQTHHNWLKSHPKLQKEPQISMMGSRRIFFRIQIKFIRFQVALLFLRN
jgi:hypothetical protein